MGTKSILSISLIAVFVSLLLVPVGSQLAFAGHTCGLGDAGKACSDSGSSNSCLGICAAGLCVPSPGPSRVGFTCGDQTITECSDRNTCTAAGICSARNHLGLCDSANECRSVGVCALGSCVLGLPDLGANDKPCGDQSETFCTDSNTCDTGVCVSNNKNAGKVCDSANECRGAGLCGFGTAITEAQCILGLPDLNANGNRCGDQSDTQCTDPNTCLAGICLPNNESDITRCDSEILECKISFCDRQTGLCIPTSIPDFGKIDEPCGDQSDTQCSNPNTCTVLGICFPNNEPLNTECTFANNFECLNDEGKCGLIGNCLPFPDPIREDLPCGDQSDTQCTNPNTCKSGICFPNNEEPRTDCTFESNSACLNDNGECGLIGNCLPVPSPINQGGACGNPSDTECDDPDTCFSGVCIPNIAIPGTTCTDGPDSCNRQLCSLSGTCVSIVPPIPLPQGTTCGDGTDTECTNPDTCDGSGTCLVNDVAPDTACADGTVCNGSETCQSGICSAGTTLSCDDGNVCTANSCDAITGCSNTPVANNTPCGDGLVCSESVCVPVDSGNDDHYLGYDAKRPKDEPKFEKFTVELSDQFEPEPTEYTVDKPDRLFNPVNKNGEGISDLISHYVGYKIKTPKDDPKFDHVENVLVSNQFGDIIVDVKKPKLLLVPSAKNHLTIPDELSNPITVNHFKCYDVKESKDTPKFVKQQVTLSDPNFEITKDFEVKKPKMLCTPVDKNGEGIIDPVNHLMCYDLKKMKDDSKFEKISVFTNNQFGPEELEVKKHKVLCVPSMKRVL